MAAEHPNLVFVLTDQWRAQATGYAGDPNVETPHLDRLAAESVAFTTAVSNCPVCSPARACLMTGQFPLTHGVFVNDVYLKHQAVSFAEALNEAGYDTAYIGKWHLDGHGRSAFIPADRRQGFRFWRGTECHHRYFDGYFYTEDGERVALEGYEPDAQTKLAQEFLENRHQGRPFALFVSWAPPHSPYETAPRHYREMYDPASLELRQNVPQKAAGRARQDLAGYYGHITALDACLGMLLGTLERLHFADNTIVVFTSDHGDMHGSQGEMRKQRPWDESILVPFVMRAPRPTGVTRTQVEMPFGTSDVMPTLLSLCGVEVPQTVEGIDFADYLRGGEAPGVEAALIASYQPFGEWLRHAGGREYRGVRTRRHTYVRDLDGPWLLFDNNNDPYQRVNLVGKPECAELQRQLDHLLQRELKRTNDDFEPGEHYIDKWGYPTDETGTVPYAE